MANGRLANCIGEGFDGDTDEEMKVVMAASFGE